MLSRLCAGPVRVFVITVVAVVAMAVRKSKDQACGGMGMQLDRKEDAIVPIWGLLPLVGEANEPFEAGGGWR